MHPKLVSIGDFFLPTYGVLVAAGFLTGLWLTVRLARRSGLNAELVANLGVYCALTGLLGAKLLMFAMNWTYYRENPARLFSLDTLLSAGVYYGGFVAALLFAAYYFRRTGLPALRTLDAFAPGVALGHAIGRLGCFAAGCCWGIACDRPWAVTFTNPDANALVGVPLGKPLHPTQLYEAFLTFMVFIVLYRRFGQKHHPGEVIAWYFLLYSPSRFFVEFLRYHDQTPPLGLGLSVTQWIACGMFALGLVYLVHIYTKKIASSLR
jgi:phosphatidylglycerol---prolipoprotein diacylglyceryl transferase